MSMCVYVHVYLNMHINADVDEYMLSMMMISVSILDWIVYSYSCEKWCI